mgnify:CR=1 FL=1
MVSLSPQKREAFVSCRGDPLLSYPQQSLTPQKREAFFLPRRSMLMLTAGVAVTTRPGSFCFLPRRSALILPAAVTDTTRPGSFFLLPRLPLSCGDSDLTPGAVTATTNHREPRRTYTKNSRLFVVAVTSDPYNYLQW